MYCMSKLQAVRDISKQLKGQGWLLIYLAVRVPKRISSIQQRIHKGPRTSILLDQTGVILKSP